ncbi:MAG: hypothetical protein HC828_11825 [Blastochloris sp.]|nr:hypothetical protein [Blastochloris sp.]
MMDELGFPQYKYFGLLIGAVLIFIGFWLTTTVPEDAQPRAHRAAQPVTQE